MSVGLTLTLIFAVVFVFVIVIVTNHFTKRRKLFPFLVKKAL
jgi:hypothetical protein